MYGGGGKAAMDITLSFCTQGIRTPPTSLGLATPLLSIMVNHGASIPRIVLLYSGVSRHLFGIVFTRLGIISYWLLIFAQDKSIMT